MNTADMDRALYESGRQAEEAWALVDRLRGELVTAQADRDLWREAARDYQRRLEELSAPANGHAEVKP